jgi:F0F1-type ATP synthase assembly protein I
MPEVGAQHTSRTAARHAHEQDLIPREFLRVIAIWSLVPAYLLAGAFLGWLFDRWLGTWPLGIAIALFIALGFAVRDMLRLRDTL